LEDQIHKINNHLQRHELAIEKLTEHNKMLVECIENNLKMINNLGDVLCEINKIVETDPGFTGINHD